LPAFDRAVGLNPNSPDAHVGRGNTLLEAPAYTEAFAAYQRALSIKPDCVEALDGLGRLCTIQGHIGDAIAWFDKALAVAPNPSVASNRIFALDFATDATFSEHQEARRTWCQSVDLSPMTAHQNGLDPHRRLTIGYVSADFKEHSASN